MVVYSSAFIILMNYEGQSKNANLTTAIYWIVCTITTLGYGDIVFHSQLGRIFSIVVSLSGLVLIWAIILPFGVSAEFEKLAKILPRAAAKDLTNHIIICGYNPVVETLVQRLLLSKTPFLIIERSENVARGLYPRYPLMLGDPSQTATLLRSNINSARLLIANEKDDLNADVILAAREASNVKIIALTEDLSRSRFLCYAGASRAISPKALLGTFIAQIMLPPKKGVFPGSIMMFGGLRLVEFPIYPGSVLIGMKTDSPEIRETGANITGVWQRGKFIATPKGDEQIQSKTVLLAVGSDHQLSKLRDLTTGTRRQGPLIILGYGDVGRRAACVLKDKGANPVIVDRRELSDLPFEHIIGEATLESVLISAGVKEAVGVLILLNRDPEVIYTSLLARTLNPNAFIIARANHVNSSDKIYRAGADFVASVPIIASHMLERISQEEDEELDLLYQDLEFRRLKVRSGLGLAGKRIGDLNLPERFGFVIAAMDRNGVAIEGIGKETRIGNGDVLALVGKPEGIDVFRKIYSRRFALNRIFKGD